MQTLPYIVASAAIAISAIAAAIRITTANPRIELKVGSLTLGGGVIWLLMSALEVSSSDISTKLLYDQIHFVGLVIIPASWLVLSMLLSGYERHITRKIIVGLSIVPLITLLLAFTNGYHGLIWTSVKLDAVDPILPLNTNYGIGYWLIVVAYSYAVLLIGSILLMRRVLMSRRLYRLQAFPLMLVLSVPWALDAMYQYNPSWFAHIQPTPLALTIAAAILMWRLIYLPAMDVLPVAHETIIDNMNDSVIVLDWEKRIVDLNPSAQALIGRTLKEVVGRHVENAWPEWQRLSRLLDAETEKTKEVTFGVGGKRQIYEIQKTDLARLGRKDALNVLIILRDITDRKIIEEKLRSYSEHLAELVEEGTKKLREAERMAAIGEMAAMVAHDLRNPLQGIIGAADILKDKSLTVDEKNEMLQLIESSVEYAEATVRDLMDYSREIYLEHVEVPPKAIIQSALRAVKVPGNVKVQDMSQEQPRISVDPDRMKRVFINLIENAIDAMLGGGTLTIASKQAGNCLEVTISDTGTGISHEIMENLWKPLQTTKAKGMGLGLPIVKRIVDAHGGSISVATKIGKGTTISILLPFKTTGVNAT
jgi:PAS domain S-box-containing protein